jgi:hypothetical protein
VIPRIGRWLPRSTPRGRRFRRADELTTFEPASLERVKNFPFRGRSRRPWEILLCRRHCHTRRAAASRRACPSTADDKGKGKYPLLPLSTYNAPGDLRQDPGRAAESPAEARTSGNGGRDVRVLSSTSDSCGDVEPLVGLAVRLRALGAELRVCVPLDEGSRIQWETRRT